MASNQNVSSDDSLPGRATRRADILIVPVPVDFDRPGRAPALETLDATAEFDVENVLDETEFHGEALELMELRPVPSLPLRAVILVGIGGDAAAREGICRRASAKAARRARQLEAERAALVFPTQTGLADEVAVHQLVQGFHFGAYQFQQYRTAPSQPVDTLTLVGSSDRTAPHADDAQTVAANVQWTRDLVNEPAGELTPAQLAERARQMAEPRGYDIDVFDEEELRSEGFGLINAVGAGSEHPPRLIHAVRPADGESVDHRVVLVGKGVTFDSGGHCLKDKTHMRHMHCDMAGAATILGAGGALADLEDALPPGTELHLAIPSAENAPGGSAYRPGDIVRAYDDTTVEIRNTDAEGRLLMADTLAYLNQVLAERGEDEPANPDVETIIIDVATLTGSSIVGLGEYTGALMSRDDELIDEIRTSSRATGESVWPLPLDRRLRKRIDTDVADITNSPGPDKKSGGGAIVAGLFLEQWVDKWAGSPNWAHLDIAGPAYAREETDEFARGGTGYGVATLVDYLKREKG